MKERERKKNQRHNSTKMSNKMCETKHQPLEN